jgi:hypothetical protein
MLIHPLNQFTVLLLDATSPGDNFILFDVEMQSILLPVDYIRSSLLFLMQVDG